MADPDEAVPNQYGADEQAGVAVAEPPANDSETTIPPDDTYTAPDGTVYLRADTAVKLSPVEQNFRASAEKAVAVRTGAIDAQLLSEQKALELKANAGALPTPEDGLTDAAVLELADRMTALEARVRVLEAK